MRAILLLTLLASMMAACSKLMPAVPADEELLDGPVTGLSSEELARFLAGDVAFNDEIFHTGNGLGPLFVATSCGACHFGDGPGHPFTTLTRFGQYDGTGNHFLDQGGPQLQHRAIPGITPEVIPSGAPSAQLLPPAITGLGFLDALTDTDILSRADPVDSDGDGISGVPNWMSKAEYSPARADAIVQGGSYIGRFGRKGATYDLLQQTATAYQQDIGVTSVFEDVDTYTGEPQDPEIATATLHDVVFYLRTLKAPIQRDANDPAVLAGGDLFISTGCEKCHREDWTTGPSPIAPLAYQAIKPYTDLLLHDMGASLDDGYTEGSATTAEWRTPPLWGLGLHAASQGGTYFLMHDGRATSIEDAILLHGGEAGQVRANFQALPAVERELLITFLESL